MSHTKGDWLYGKRRDGSMWLSIGNPQTGPHFQGNLVASEDDARLIVAAPGLINAARLAMEGVEVLDLLIASIEQHGNYSVESTLGFLNQARCAKLRLSEAIAKAEARP